MMNCSYVTGRTDARRAGHTGAVMRHLPLLIVLGCAPGSSTGAPEACAPLCDLLYDDCGLEGFPERADCDAGCVDAADRGADLDGYLDCVGAAACDPFALVACEEAHGVE